jgi:hypothetical protein
LKVSIGRVRLNARASERFSGRAIGTGTPGYNKVIIPLKHLAGDSNHASLDVGEGIRSTGLKRPQ